jgi:hypothetical protein
VSTATRLPVGRPPRPTDLADRAAVERIASLAKAVMVAVRKPGRGVWDSERQLRQWLSDSEIQFSASDLAIALNLLEGIGLIQRATVKPNAARAGWLVTAVDKAAERGLTVNGEGP